MASPTQRRDQAANLAKSNTTAALAIADAIDDPWFKSQALAWVARFASPDSVVALGRRAMVAALEASEPYRRVFPAAWAIRAMIETGNEAEADAMLAKVVKLVSRIEPTESRAEAIDVLLHAVIPAKRPLWAPVVDCLVKASTAGYWRGTRAIRDAVLLLSSIDVPAARRVSDVAEVKETQRLLERLEAGETQRPRPFFW